MKSSKKKRLQEDDLANHYVLSDHQVTTLVLGEMARLREDMVSTIRQIMEDVARDNDHPFAVRLREIIREELANLKSTKKSKSESA